MSLDKFLDKTNKEELKRLLENAKIKVRAPDGAILYGALPHQEAAHISPAPNLLNLGTRGTGKSRQLRWDAIIRCLLVPNFHALIVRRTMPELRETHLNDIAIEMHKLGGEKNGFIYLSTIHTAKFPNGSSITFGHCETAADMMTFLGKQYGFVGFDELSTFSLEQFLGIAAACRAPEDAPYSAVVRASSNPLGAGAQWMKDWFVDKTVRLEDYPDYHPDDFAYIFSTLEDNPFLNRRDYEKRLRNLPDHIRRAWLKGEFVIQGAYFTDFHQTKENEETGKIEPWHVIDEIPYYQTANGYTVPIDRLPWMRVYRAVDWGFDPDPAVCLWIAVMQNNQAIVFKEMKWYRTIAPEVAKIIKRESEGMKVVETFCDPQMFIKTGATDYSIGEQFEMQGVPMTESVNKRELYGYSIHQYLNTMIDGKPQLQIVRGGGGYGCPELIHTIPMLRMDPADPRKIADGDDHHAVALSYFCMGAAPPSYIPVEKKLPRWMQRKKRKRRY